MRNGADARAPSAKVAYREMLLQVARDFAGLPDPRGLSIHQIAYFYRGLQPELRKYTKPKASPLSPVKRPPRKPGKPKK